MCRRSAKQCKTPWGFTRGGDSFLLHPWPCRDPALLRQQGNIRKVRSSSCCGSGQVTSAQVNSLQAPGLWNSPRGVIRCPLPTMRQTGKSATAAEQLPRAEPSPALPASSARAPGALLLPTGAVQVGTRRPPLQPRRGNRTVTRSLISPYQYKAVTGSCRLVCVREADTATGA